MKMKAEQLGTGVKDKIQISCVKYWEIMKDGVGHHHLEMAYISSV